MTAVYALLALAVGVGIGFTVIVIGDLRWEARNRLPRCSTCGEQHHRHAVHR
ncbi:MULTISPECIES: hypothetical protein [unclassified Streptomyces]|uniref:hypothetical protein n=1 Tax=unclassified Streptomyces TaxID=2593676 RepID=UPI002E1423F2|nr:hypothetical protein OG452_24905 [Streptomyces sp. NBC_01197]WSS49007.1 hypothetical protein OG708_10340 [Streptomyces sp. NBC_01180]